DEVLRPMFPDDMEPGKRWQFLFLSQFFGGPTDYGAERGHPRLRMRHMPCVIDNTARDRRLTQMLEAVIEVSHDEPIGSVRAERGHPRLRMRHMPFVIDDTARDRWLTHMIAAVNEVGIEEPMRSVMVDYFVRAAEHMINVRQENEVR